MQVYSHRGGRGFGQDNTLEAMQAAADAGVLAIETDVHATADGELLISHDPTVGKHSIKRSQFADIRRDHPDRPLLGEVLDSLAERVSFNIEVKMAPPADVGKMVSSYGVMEKTVFSSFHHNLMVEMKKDYPEARVGPLRWEFLPEHVSAKWTRTVKAEFIALHFKAITPRSAEQIHRAGLKVTAWTVNEEDEVRRLESLGVDVLITDRYLDMVELLEGGGAGS
jgi:glycerophosphoryl diester phosphodiesterase